MGTFNETLKNFKRGKLYNQVWMLENNFGRYIQEYLRDVAFGSRGIVGI